MKKAVIILSAIVLLGCTPTAKDKTVQETQIVPATQPALEAQTGFETYNRHRIPASFVPEGYRIFEEIQGDLNKDGIPDIVLIIKNTDVENIVNDEYRGELDRNRRGIIIALKKEDSYELIVRNLSCFSSENEDGGVYFAPELSVGITTKGNLQFHYGHGRYGWSLYTFRYQNDDFELIGYDQEDHHGPVLLTGWSINFLTKKMKIRENLNPYAEDESEEEIKTTWENIEIHNLYKLSEMESINETFDISSSYVRE
jgi:hypothetical protein